MKPSGIPEAAVWNEAESEWELGETRDGVHVGEWNWWRPEGALVCRSFFNEQGQLHGECNRYHPNGDSSYTATYASGKKHGKEIICRPISGETTEVGALQLCQINPQLHRMETLWIEGEMRAATLYNRHGLVDPVPRTSSGAGELDGQLHKLLSGTSLSMTTPFLHTMGSAPSKMVQAMMEGVDRESSLVLPAKIPISMVTSLQYICPAVEGGTQHRIGVVDHRGQSHVAIVEADDISRSLKLAVDVEIAVL